MNGFLIDTNVISEFVRRSEPAATGGQGDCRSVGTDHDSSEEEEWAARLSTWFQKYDRVFEGSRSLIVDPLGIFKY